MSNADYRVKVGVRNAKILRAIENDGCDSVAGFCKKWGIENQYQSIIGLITFKKSPINRGNLKEGDNYQSGGVLTTAAQALCDALCALPEDLWTEDQLWLWLPKNTASVDVSEDEMTRMLEQMDARKALALIGDKTNAREWKAMERIGLEDQTLESVGRELGVTRERVRQIEARAIRKMRVKGAIKLSPEDIDSLVS